MGANLAHGGHLTTDIHELLRQVLQDSYGVSRDGTDYDEVAEIAKANCQS